MVIVGFPKFERYGTSKSSEGTGVVLPMRFDIMGVVGGIKFVPGWLSDEIGVEKFPSWSLLAPLKEFGASKEVASVGKVPEASAVKA